ncbi:MAG TPA: TIGR03790 family protein, partial [Pyrinomonadaceae bacterium]|nr:TIGR03790 family protein [Pyrinomonadaceae bacterium]
MKNKLIRFLIIIFTLAPFLVQAGGDEVIVIYNKKMPGSKDVADYYAKMRNVPAKQIYGFNLTTSEEISRTEFRDALQLPLFKKLESDGLWTLTKTSIPATNGQPAREFRRVTASKIRYAVLCYGVPLRIANDPTLHEATASTFPLLFQRNEAAVDSELTLLPVMEINLPLVGPQQNPFYGVTNAALLNPTNGILLVSRLDGPSAEIARGLVDKSLQAERDGLWGRMYFDTRGIQPS